MNRAKGSNSNRGYKAYHPGDFYDSLPQASKEAYTAGTIKTAGKRRVIPEHILKLMAQPEHRDEVIASLGLTDGDTGEAIESISGLIPCYYSRLKAVPTARCYVCDTLYKLSAIKYHRPSSLVPEQPICTWCYRALKCDGLLIPIATPGPKTDRGYTGTRAKSLSSKLLLAATVLLEQASAATPAQIDRYIEELGAGPRPLVELYFDKNDKLMNDQRLVEDFIDQLTPEAAPEDLEEFIYIP